MLFLSKSESFLSFPLEDNKYFSILSIIEVVLMSIIEVGVGVREAISLFLHSRSHFSKKKWGVRKNFDLTTLFVPFSAQCDD